MILGFPRAKQGLCHYKQSLIRYFSKTAEQNFMKLSGIVHYMVPYCISYFKFFFELFGVSYNKTKDFVQGLVVQGGTNLSFTH